MFTKGYWRAIKLDKNFHIIVEERAGIKNIAFLENWMHSYEDNAKLISAAPEMYEALQQIMVIIRAFNGMLSQRCTDEAIVNAMNVLLDNPIFENAIAKAEGLS